MALAARAATWTKSSAAKASTWFHMAPTARRRRAGHKVVIFNNVPQERFSAGYLASIERHVADGGSFVMLGADASFSQNSYRQTPIERSCRWYRKNRPNSRKKTAPSSWL